MIFDKADSTAYSISGKTSLRKELIVFYVLSLLLSFPVLLLWNPPEDLKIGDLKALEESFGNLPMLYALGPLVAALSVTWVYRKKEGLIRLLKRVILWRFSWLWYVLALTVPIIPQWISLFIWAEITDTTLTLPTFTVYLSSWLQITFISTIFFITEEIGWRGFMLPRILSIHHWLKASIIVGLFWAIWHYPIWFVSGLAFTGSWTQESIEIVASSIFAIGLSMLITWIFINSRGSILIAMLFHGSNNASRKLIYEAAGDTATTGTSFSIISAMITLIFAVIVCLAAAYKRKV